MPLYTSKTIVDGLKLVVWELNESIADLLEKVVLNKEELESFNAITRVEKKREFLAGRFVVEKGCELLELDFQGLEKDDYGKPYLKDLALEISLTHTDEFIAVLYSEIGPVGIDLEQPRDKIMRVLPRLFSEQEIADVDNDLNLGTIYWSAKEALYKLYGRRGVNFKENLLLNYQDGLLSAHIRMPDFDKPCSFHIETVGNYYLVAAY